MKHTTLITYFVHESNSIESGQFFHSSMEEYLTKLKTLLLCEIWLKDSDVLISHNRLRVDKWIGVDEYTPKNTSSIFYSAMEVIIAKEDLKTCRIFTVKGEHTFDTSNFQYQRNFFDL